jgi:hypothetical protein
MFIKFRRETKIILILLGLIIIGAAVFIAINYKKLKQSAPPPQNVAAQVKGANLPIQPRGAN